MALSVHPGAVATEQQKGAAEGGAYGMFGKALEEASKVLFMSAEQGSESAVWAGTGTTVAERREEVQGGYFTEADGKVGHEVLLRSFLLMFMIGWHGDVSGAGRQPRAKALGPQRADPEGQGRIPCEDVEARTA